MSTWRLRGILGALDIFLEEEPPSLAVALIQHLQDTEISEASLPFSRRCFQEHVSSFAYRNDMEGADRLSVHLQQMASALRRRKNRKPSLEARLTTSSAITTTSSQDLSQCGHEQLTSPSTPAYSTIGATDNHIESASPLQHAVRAAS